MKDYIHFINENNNFSFRKEIENNGGKIYFVGGKVRDDILGIKSKDIDILITGIPMNKLESILKKYGKVISVGKSFGILKFKEDGSDEELDVAIPRIEKKINFGHTGFEIQSNHTLPIEKDLFRRDITINAIARDLDNNIVDPYGGMEDIKNKVIRIVNPDAFIEDPLRLLRICQFASRFAFTIESKTFEMIKNNASLIKEITKDRIIFEFQKIVDKGNPKIGIEILDKSTLFYNIFEINFVGSYSQFEKVKTLGEFIYLCLKDTDIDPSSFFKNKLKGDLETTRNIKSLELISELGDDIVENRLIASAMYSRFPDVIGSEIIPNKLKSIFDEFKNGDYPKNIRDLVINGNDLIEIGVSPIRIKDMQDQIMRNIYSDKLKNDKNYLLNFVKRIL